MSTSFIPLLKERQVRIPCALLGAQSEPDSVGKYGEDTHRTACDPAARLGAAARRAEGGREEATVWRRARQRS